MLILKAQQSPWTLGRSIENIWSWQLEKIHFAWKHLAMEERHCKGMSSCHNCTIAHLKKWPTRCQQGVNKVSTRCQICNHLPRKICKSSYLSFVCRQKVIFVFVFAFVICFFGGRDEVQKKMIFWKNGGGGEQNVGFNNWAIIPLGHFCAVEAQASEVPRHWNT